MFRSLSLIYFFKLICKEFLIWEYLVIMSYPQLTAAFPYSFSWSCWKTSENLTCWNTVFTRQPRAKKMADWMDGWSVFVCPSCVCILYVPILSTSHNRPVFAIIEYYLLWSVIARHLSIFPLVKHQYFNKLMSDLTLLLWITHTAVLCLSLWHAEVKGRDFEYQVSEKLYSRGVEMWKNWSTPQKWPFQTNREMCRDYQDQQMLRSQQYLYIALERRSVWNFSMVNLLWFQYLDQRWFGLQGSLMSYKAVYLESKA